MAPESKGSISIPMEIITEILYRLPAKSLGQFRCVSKEWLSLLSDPKFIKTHLKTLNQNLIIFKSRNDLLLYSHPFNHHESLLKPTKFHFETDVNHDSFFFYNSCDDLVLVHHLHSDDSHGLILYNPTTREFFKLPSTGSYQMIDDNDNIRIDTIEGFGYDSVTDDYKVVSVTYYTSCKSRPHSVYVNVYSLRTNTWNLLIDSAHYYYFPGDCYGKLDGVFVNGFVHWITKKRSDRSPVIIAFSLADEIFSEVPFPILCHDDVDLISKKYYVLLVLGGKLAIFVEGVVWLMNEYGKTESWIKILFHGLDEIQMDQPAVFEDSGRVLLADWDRMLLYNIEEESFGKIVYVLNRKRFRVEGTCVESLVSPKFNSEA